MKKSPKAPTHLSKQAAAFWREVTRDFELESDAVLVLQSACECWDRAQGAREAIARDGMVLIGGKPHPALAVEKQAYSLFLRSMRQLGLDIVAPGSGVAAGRKF